MRNFIPLSLYVHLPWCVRKCPYCDFNSHELALTQKNNLPEHEYIDALLQDLDDHLPLIADRTLTSIFFGGGTPSLFSGSGFQRIIDGIKERIFAPSSIEITIEANPGTIDFARFTEFRAASINRLSLGVQSLQNDKLKTLGRIHNGQEAERAIQIAKEVGFNNFNIDIMFGLPNQTIQDAMHDLELALSFEPTHFSWYQLTIEPNTVFYKKTPQMPADDLIWEMQIAGQEYLKNKGFAQYEVSAYAKPDHRCVHNINYWTFGDYLGIGAGAHSKITDDQGIVKRFSQMKQPKDYMDQTKRKNVSEKIVTEKDLIFEFMLNALRLTEGTPVDLFTMRTGLSLTKIQPLLDQIKAKKMMVERDNVICLTPLGRRFLNDVVMMFLF